MNSDDTKSQSSAVNSMDLVIEYYKQFVDHDALRENLKLTVEQRLVRLRKLQAEALRNEELARSGAGG